jgi:hypothetical protein
MRTRCAIRSTGTIITTVDSAPSIFRSPEAINVRTDNRCPPSHLRCPRRGTLRAAFWCSALGAARTSESFPRLRPSKRNEWTAVKITPRPLRR